MVNEKKKKKRVSRARSFMTKKKKRPPPPVHVNAEEPPKKKTKNIADGIESPPVFASVEVVQKPLVTSSVSLSPTIVPPDNPFVSVATSPTKSTGTVIAERHSIPIPPGRDEDRMQSPASIPINDVAVQSGSVLQPRGSTCRMEIIVDAADAKTSDNIPVAVSRTGMPPSTARNPRRTERIIDSGRAPLSTQNTKRKEVVLESGTPPLPPKSRQRNEIILESGSAVPPKPPRNNHITETVLESGSAGLPPRNRQITETVLDSGSVARPRNRRTEIILDSGSAAPTRNQERTEIILDSGSAPLASTTRQRTETVLYSGTAPAAPLYSSRSEPRSEPSSARIKSVNGPRREEILDSGIVGGNDSYETPPTRPNERSGRVLRDEHIFDSYLKDLPSVTRRERTEEIIDSGSGLSHENENGATRGRIARAANRPLPKTIIAGALENIDERRARNNDLPSSPILIESDNDYFSATDGPPDGEDNMDVSQPNESIPPTQASSENPAVNPAVANGDGGHLENTRNRNGEDTGAAKTALSKRQRPQVVPSPAAEDATPISPAPTVTERHPDEIVGDQWLIEVNRRNAYVSPEAAERRKRDEAELDIQLRGLKRVSERTAPMRGISPSEKREKPKQDESTSPEHENDKNSGNNDGKKKSKKEKLGELGYTKNSIQSWRNWETMGNPVPRNGTRGLRRGGQNNRYGNTNGNKNGDGNRNGNVNGNGNDHRINKNRVRNYHDNSRNSNGRGNGKNVSNHYEYRRGGPNYQGNTSKDDDYPGDQFYMDRIGNENGTSPPRNRQDNQRFNYGKGVNDYQPNGAAKFGADKSSRYFNNIVDNGTAENTPPPPRQNQNNQKKSEEKKAVKDDSPRIVTVKGRKRLEYNPHHNNPDVWKLAAEATVITGNYREPPKTPPAAVAVQDNHVRESGLIPEQIRRASRPPARQNRPVLSPEERARVNGTATLEIPDEITAAVPVREERPLAPVPAPVPAPARTPARTPAPVIARRTATTPILARPATSAAAPAPATASIRTRTAPPATPPGPSMVQGNGGKNGGTKEQIEPTTPAEEVFDEKPGDCTKVLPTTDMPHRKYIWEECRRSLLIERVLKMLLGDKNGYKFDNKNIGAHTKDFLDGNFVKFDFKSLLSQAVNEEFRRGRKRVANKRRRDNKRNRRNWGNSYAAVSDKDRAAMKNEPNGNKYGRVQVANKKEEEESKYLYWQRRP